MHAHNFEYSLGQFEGTAKMYGCSCGAQADESQVTDLVGDPKQDIDLAKYLNNNALEAAATGN